MLQNPLDKLIHFGPLLIRAPKAAAKSGDKSSHSKLVNRELDIYVVGLMIMRDRRLGVSTGSGSDRVSEIIITAVNFNAQIPITRSLPLPVLTSMTSAVETNPSAEQDRIQLFHRTQTRAPVASFVNVLQIACFTRRDFTCIVWGLR